MVSTSQFSLRTFASHASTRGFTPTVVHWPPTATSTNEELAVAYSRAPQDWPDFALYGTDFQTAGKARLDRTWTVHPGQALTFSTLVRLPAGAPASGWIPLITGWAIAQALSDCAIEATVKWPNDVLVEDKKICGILCRFVPGDPAAVIIGAGINVTLDDLPVAGATSAHLHGDVTREELLAAIMGYLAPALTSALASTNLGECPAAQAARQAISTVGKHVRVELPGGATLTGLATGLSDTGDLLVRTDRGEETVSAGDVIHVRPA